MSVLKSEIKTSALDGLEASISDFGRVIILGAWNFKVPNFKEATKFYSSCSKFVFLGSKIKGVMKKGQYFLNQVLGGTRHHNFSASIWNVNKTKKCIFSFLHFQKTIFHIHVSGSTNQVKRNCEKAHKPTFPIKNWS